MAENQNDQRNPDKNRDSKSNQQSTQEGNRRETDPNNPKANQGTPQGTEQRQGAGSQQSGKPEEGSSSAQGRTDADVLNTEEDEEQNTEERSSGKTGNQNPQKGNI